MKGEYWVVISGLGVWLLGYVTALYLAAHLERQVMIVLGVGP